MTTNVSKFSWTDPTTNVDGSAISGAELTGYTLGIGVATGNYTELVAITPGTATSEALASITPPLASGTYFAAIRAESVNGPSAWSTEVTFTLVPSAPNVPTGFGVA